MERKRVAVISEDLVEPWDEGIKKFAFSIAGALNDANDVLLLNVARSHQESIEAQNAPGTRTFLHPALLSKLGAFLPDLVLYVPSPSSTLASFLRATVLKRLYPRRPVGMVAVIPRRHPVVVKPLLRTLAPDVVFVPSYRSLLYLSRLGIRPALLPLGVDIERFHPARSEEKLALRGKYGIAKEDFVFLHVGHLSRKRNIVALRVLKKAAARVHVIMVSSTSTPDDRDLRSELELYGIEVIREYVPVEEFYRLSDAYVFPVMDEEGCIELPLSVLEALACRLPVLSTRFGGLPDFFPEERGLYYWESMEELLGKAKALASRESAVSMEMERFSWKSVASRVMAEMAAIDGGK